MVDFSRLSANWFEWTSRARIGGVAVSEDCEDCQVAFTSDNESFHLRQENDWWVVDKIDDRNQRRNDLARFSTFDLVEKYLIWRWSSITRSAIGAKSLGAQLQRLGMAPGVESAATDREGAVELRTSDGSAVVPRSIENIFSHLMSKPMNEIEQLVHEGLR
ncbi:Imm61 family immunity protein [Mycolicibacterium gadium]|uniref:Uncharacterized protein n=1 Tax=Mycolicibacterium gadium TaxID=1794 RepID=A0A7I7WNR1_MYCGU|nr:Imm61 family immunity protein [Mycolicibacterium gadium]BBZ18612.1 hypothetical protein MGAD_29470 [Mycolicibacterium gadium]